MLQVAARGSSAIATRPYTRVGGTVGTLRNGMFRVAYLLLCFQRASDSPARLKNPNPTGFQWFVTDYLFSGSFSRPVCRPARISEIVR
jgi:hypothetical protein